MKKTIGILAAMATCAMTACTVPVETDPEVDEPGEASDGLTLLCYDGNPCTSDTLTSGVAGNYCVFDALPGGTACETERCSGACFPPLRNPDGTLTPGNCGCGATPTLECREVGDNGPCRIDAECDDGNECTDDICIDDLGQCGHYLLNNSATCNGGDGRCDGNGCCCNGCFERGPSGGFECVSACSSGNKCDLPNQMCCTEGDVCGGDATKDVHGECSGGGCVWTNWTCVHSGAGAACNDGVDTCTSDGVCCSGCINSAGSCLPCFGTMHGAACPAESC